MNDVVVLISYAEGVDVYGNVTDASETRKTVFIEEKGVRQSEAYQAQAQGLKADRMFIMRYADYEDEEVLEHNGKRFNIIRTHRKDADYIEIVCQRDIRG